MIKKIDRFFTTIINDEGLFFLALEIFGVISFIIIIGGSFILGWI